MSDPITNPRRARVKITPAAKKPSGATPEPSPEQPKQSPRKKPQRAKIAPKPAGPQEKISVLIVDDHPVFRSGLRSVLELEDTIQVVGEAQDGQQALDLGRSLRPQVILMDINLPLVNGMQATRELTAERSDLAVIILTAYHDDEQMLQAMRSGASGYFPKEVAPDQLLQAIRAASHGRYAIDEDVFAKPQVAGWLLYEFEAAQENSASESADMLRVLSSREMEILKLITRGFSNKEIAKSLGISRQTVKNHMTSILRKLAVNDRTQAAVYALRRGWVPLQDTE